MTNIYRLQLIAADRQLIPLTHAQNASVIFPSAVVCAVCSIAAFWSDAADANPHFV